MSKVEMLIRAADIVRSARVLPIEYFSVAEWLADAGAIRRRLFAQDWAAGPLVVRSSAYDEDLAWATAAGRYTSVLDVRGEGAFAEAVEAVRESYGPGRNGGDCIFVQPMLEAGRASGVAKSFDPVGGGAYRIICWTEGPATDLVTGGRGAGLRTWYGTGGAGAPEDPAIGQVLGCLDEIERVLGLTRFEMEFGIGATGELYLFQVREITGAAGVPSPSFGAALAQVRAEADGSASRDGRILGSGVLLGAMADWNPAEMIGQRPAPLPHWLYRRLITDGAWAERRAAYGYRDMRGVPLMAALCGQPMIDIRASFTSFVPAALPDDIAGRLVDAYAGRLRARPDLHDKIEFDIAQTCLSFTSGEALRGFVGEGLRPGDVGAVEDALASMTGDLCRAELVEGELSLVRQLAAGRGAVAGLPPLERVARLLSDAQVYGTVPFGGLARLGFVATTILRSGVAAGLLAGDDLERFFAGLDLPSTRMQADLAALPRAAFLARYGHLRPGTYDICSARYDEAPEFYFGDASGAAPVASPKAPSPAMAEALDARLADLGVRTGGAAFLGFARAAIEAREWAKFEFTVNVSAALQALEHWGAGIGLDRQAVAMLTLDQIEAAAGLEAGAAQAALLPQVDAARREMAVSQAVCLPLLLRGAGECLAFEMLDGTPNFITNRRVVARVADVDKGADPRGAIVFIQNADPGYDWIFTRGIAGLVTAYGGANSHMAVRALENQIPAAIGCGPGRFATLGGCRMLELDAGAHVLRGVA